MPFTPVRLGRAITALLKADACSLCRSGKLLDRRSASRLHDGWASERRRDVPGARVWRTSTHRLLNRLLTKLPRRMRGSLYVQFGSSPLGCVVQIDRGSDEGGAARVCSSDRDVQP